MSDDSISVLPVRIIVPVTWWKAQYASNPLKALVKANQSTGLKREGSADAIQVRCVSLERFEKKLGVLPAHSIDDVAMAVGMCMGYPGL